MTERVVLYSRQGCHLCDEGRGVVQAVCADRGVLWTEVDIDADPALKERYGEEVPVVTVDGETVAFWRIEPTLLAAALARHDAV
ncbi:glutaredoxin family protein [Demequina capsici]|uniref:Glutaredoxin family protein n=1 Tax=Demequina capsici TaxID=3075620 RepID=A0AA96FEM4_9MICO|nr:MULTISPECIES: glutaredoxin family protein [unclassified Demequina]WNM24207.1 glutaredoxin family protein [Demequina sp. OYTSA14]WNM27035.1 glutaredoxin family protein [Demequina sp. PMTSA13]